jgi:hypothetical protein
MSAKPGRPRSDDLQTSRHSAYRGCYRDVGKLQGPSSAIPFSERLNRKRNA